MREQEAPLPIVASLSDVESIGAAMSAAAWQAGGSAYCSFGGDYVPAEPGTPAAVLHKRFERATRMPQKRTKQPRRD